jgi:hypothetical protein
MLDKNFGELAVVRRRPGDLLDRLAVNPHLMAVVQAFKTFSAGVGKLCHGWTSQSPTVPVTCVLMAITSVVA